MGQKLDAVTYVLGESLQLVKRAPEAKGTWDFMEMVARWIFPLGSGGIALLVQDYIPGVKNLYPWAMPSIVFVAAYAGLVFITAVRLRIQVVSTLSSGIITT